MQKRFFNIMLFLIIAVMLFAPMAVFAEETTVYTVKFNRGYTFIDTLRNREGDHLFTGTIPASVKVNKGGEVVLPENTVVFADYVFVGWKYQRPDENGEHTDSKGNKYTIEMYQPGDVFKNVTSNITFYAVWERPYIEVKVHGNIVFDKGDTDCTETMKNVSFLYGALVKLPENAYTKDGYVFGGWVDNKGVLYKNGAEITPSVYNLVLTAVWTRDTALLPTHTVTFTSGATDVKGNAPATIEIYKKNVFTAPANTFVREGYKFLYWKDSKNNRYQEGKEYGIPDSAEIVLTAVWEKVDEKHKVNVNITGRGTVNPSSPQVLKEGSNIEFNITCENGFAVYSVKINGKEASPSNVITVENVKADTVVDVVVKKQYTVTVEHTDGTNILETENILVFENESLSDVIKSFDGFELDRIEADGKDITSQSAIIENVTKQSTVKVYYKASESVHTSSEESETEESQSSATEQTEESSITIGDDVIEAKYLLILGAFVILLAIGVAIVKLKK